MALRRLADLEGKDKERADDGEGMGGDEITNGEQLNIMQANVSEQKDQLV